MPPNPKKKKFVKVNLKSQLPLHPISVESLLNLYYKLILFANPKENSIVHRVEEVGKMNDLKKMMSSGDSPYFEVCIIILSSQFGQTCD